MGGIKNRDKKRLQNNVFTSGGGGGSKGPAVVDKRNQETRCPYCDKVFKQSGRLKEHVASKHAEEAAVAEGASSSQSAAGPAPSASQGEQGKADRQGAAAAAKGKMMEVGSRAGYYTTKSPKMLLHELCQREGQPKPRYRTRPQDSGAFSCKVVVPHGKDANKDVVVFLGDEHLADSEEEAQQRAAVAALHRLQSNRSLERVLPSQYVGMWKALEASAKQRAERQAAAEDRARERAERERRRSEMERRREPKAVVMSSEKQRLVQELLLDDAPTPLAPAGSLEHRADSDEREGCEAQVEQAKQQLLSQGFSAADVDAALRAVAGRSAGVQQQAVYEMALDLMVLKLPEDRLPATFKGPSTNTINILHQRTTQAAPPAGQPGADADGDRPVALRPLQEEESSEPAVAELSLLGYDREDAEAALAACGGDAAGAWRALFLALLEQGGAAASEERAEGEGGTEAAWEEEVQVLQAIYSNDVVEQSVGDAPRRMALRLQAGCGELQLKLLLPVEPGYPYRLPVFGLQSQAVPSSVLREATRRVGEAAVQLLGQPMVHELAEQAVAAVEELEGRRVGRKVNAAAVEEAGPEAAASGGGGVAPAVHASADAEAGTEVRARQPGKGRGGGGKRGWTPRQEAEESRRLQQHQQAWNAGSTEAMRSMRSRRRKLPAHGQRSDIVSCVVRHQVVVLSGTTGCGKSTQVPQFILEDAVERGRGGACNIICTQPRRLSAMSLAARVAQERCETLGSSVGYSVRLDSCSSAQTRLLFCTTGILLRRLISDRSLTGVSHVIVDEVHERSLDSDLLLLLLRDLLASGSQLQLVLMSATADSALFAEYFGCGATGAKLSVGTLTIPGFTYPVREMYLEDVLEETGFAVGPNSKWAKAKQAQPGGSVQLEAAAAAGGPLESEGQYSAATLRSLQLLDEELLNYSLLEQLVACILSGVRREGARAFLSDWREAGQGEAASDAGSGALLVFLPGMMEIQRLAERLTASADVRSALGGEKLQVLPLHGSLPAAQQARVFNRPGPGCHKVILSTNIAETSVTIDDITMVVDAGRLREVQYDAERGISALTEAWVSQASAQQRRGRAGRVRAGVCWRLFSRAKWRGLAKQQAPEICRMPLEALCLNVKAVLPQDSVRDVLRRAITPPPQQAVEAALLRLAAMRALDRSPSSGGGEMLTALGRHIVRMPADPRVAKMLVFAALLRCLSPVLTVAAAMLYGRPIFLSPPDKRGAANDARAALLQPVAGAKSDHIAIVLAYGVWRRELGVQGRRAASQWCSRSFVSEQAMEEIHRARLDLARQLQDLGFASRAFCDSLVSGDDLAALSQMAGSRAQQDGVQEEDANAGNSRFLKAAVCAGFYPSILRVEHPQKKYKDVSGGTVAAENAPSALKFFDREKGRVFLHPSSVNFSAGEFESGWLIVTQMMQTSKVFVRECSMVPLYAILLFGGELSADLEKGIVKVDGWATFQAPARIAVFVKKLRQQLDGLLSAKLADPELRLADLPQIRVLEQLLASDGF